MPLVARILNKLAFILSNVRLIGMIMPKYPCSGDAIYSAINFNNNITVGTEGYSPRSLTTFPIHLLLYHQMN